MPGSDGQGPAWPAACNIGPNPTFGETTRKVEAHLIGFTGDLYGKTVELDFLERLRGTQRFSGLEELLRQVQADIEQTSQIVSPNDNSDVSAVEFDRFDIATKELV